MARIEVLEGTWEELSARAEEFKGRRLRLLVLPEETVTTAVTPDETVLRERAVWLFAEADNIERTFRATRHDPRKAAFGDIITDKYQRQQGQSTCSYCFGGLPGGSISTRRFSRVAMSF